MTVAGPVSHGKRDRCGAAPAHGFPATLACVDVATVKRALMRMPNLGLLWWQRRLVRAGLAP